MTDINTTGRRLDAIARNSIYAKGTNAAMIEYTATILERYLTKDTRTLELGPAEGILTGMLLDLTSDLTVVEGSSVFCARLREEFPDLMIVESLFEDYSPDQPFDQVVLGHVLEHTEDPIPLLRRIREWLVPGGLLFAAVPNSSSLHRQAAVLMGMLAAEDAMSEKDIRHGHHRVYRPALLREQVIAAGLTLETYGGYWLKPLSDAQLEKDWTPELLAAFMRLGERYPDIAAEIYVVARA